MKSILVLLFVSKSLFTWKISLFSLLNQGQWIPLKMRKISHCLCSGQRALILWKKRELSHLFIFYQLKSDEQPLKGFVWMQGIGTLSEMGLASMFKR